MFETSFTLLQIFILNSQVHICRNEWHKHHNVQMNNYIQIIHISISAYSLMAVVPPPPHSLSHPLCILPGS